MILFLVLMPLCLALSYNIYHAVFYYVRTVELMQLRHIENSLTKGLLIIASTLCTSNAATLMAWGKLQSRTMRLRFPIWPTENKNSLFSGYSGSVSITSDHGYLNIACILTHENRACNSGSCTLIYKNPKEPSSGLVLKYWSIT